MTGDYGNATALRNNESFLREIFGKDWKHAHVCAIAGDPKFDEGNNWAGGLAETTLRTLTGTTGNYFSVSLFKGQLRRQVHFDRLMCLVIDDVGPRLEPALVTLLLGPPTWIVESSRDNFQWGYLLDVPITDFSAAAALIKRVRVMLTGTEGKDPGMQDVTRYMRLPSGVNRKKSLGEIWHVRLRKFDKTIRLKADDLLVLGQRDKTSGGDQSAGEVLDSPSSASSGENPGIARIGNYQADSLWSAMNKLGLVLGRPRSTAMGWGFDIRCPWVDEHTDRAETGTVYVAGAGKFKCQHGHCSERTVADVWPRLDELLKANGHAGGMLHEEFDAVDPGTVPVPPQGLKQTSQSEAELFDRFVVMLGRNIFYDLHKNCETTATEIDAEYAKRLVQVLPVVGKKPLPPNKWLLQDKRGRRVTGLIGWPGMPRVFAPDEDHPQRLQVNTWEAIARPLQHVPDAEVDEKAVALWLKVFWHVVGWDSVEQYAIGEIVLDWMALLLGDLSIKSGWQIIIMGPQGLGKDSVILPLAKTLGRLAQTVQTQQFGSDFNEWAGGRLAIGSELKQNTRGTMTGHDVMGLLKSVFDNTRHWLIVNPKYGRKYDCRNVVMGWFTSNDREPLRLEPGDRRFMVIDRDGTTPLSQDTYTQLHRWLTSCAPNTNSTGIMRVAEFLYRRWDRMTPARKDVLTGIAPMTAAKQELLSRLVNPIDDWIERTMRLHGTNPLSFPSIVRASYVHSRLSLAISSGGEGLPGGVTLPTLSRMGQHLRAAGAVLLNKGKPVKVNGELATLWAVRDFALYKTLQPHELARIFAQPSSGTSAKGLLN